MDLNMQKLCMALAYNLLSRHDGSFTVRWSEVEDLLKNIEQLDITIEHDGPFVTFRNGRRGPLRFFNPQDVFPAFRHFDQMIRGMDRELFYGKRQPELPLNNEDATILRSMGIKP